MTDVERLKHQRKMLDARILAAERCQLAKGLRDVMLPLASRQDLPVVNIMEETLLAWKNQPEVRHTVAEFLEILAATVSGYPDGASDG